MVVQEEQYDPWGLSLAGLSSQSMVNSNRFKFIGREEQQGLGWIDLQARPYDPQTGRFTGVDPLPDTEGQESISTYHYSYNNPIRFSDPDGKMGEDCCDGIGSFLMGVGGAIRDNLSPDGGGSRRDTPANAGLYNSGREAGHQVSLVLSAGIIAAGILGDGVALGGEIVTAGLATVPAAALAVASTGAVVYGAGVANNAINNRINDKGRINYDGDPSQLRRTKHVDNRHVERNNYPEKSKYIKPNQKEKLQNRTIKNPDLVESQRGNRVKYTKDFGRKIGTDGQTNHTVVVDEKKKKIITSFPSN